MENIKEQFTRLYMELDLTDDQAAMINKLQRDVDAALRQPPVSGSLPFNGVSDGVNYGVSDGVNYRDEGNDRYHKN